MTKVEYVIWMINTQSQQQDYLWQHPAWLACIHKPCLPLDSIIYWYVIITAKVDIFQKTILGNWLSDPHQNPDATAEFSLLPLHVAGPYRGGQLNLSHLYISSYTPTLTALVRARRNVALAKSSTNENRFLTVARVNSILSAANWTSSLNVLCKVSPCSHALKVRNRDLVTSADTTTIDLSQTRTRIDTGDLFDGIQRRTRGALYT
jgi:hypothetical protein